MRSLALLFLLPSIAVAQVSEEAQRHTEAGRKHYQLGQYENAIAEFKAAFDIKPESRALYNIAKAYEKMSRFDDAIDYYKQYLALDPTALDRADVEQTIKQLKIVCPIPFQLAVSSDPPGADIYLDSRNAGLHGQTNYYLKLAPGPHTLYLDLNGYEPWKRELVMPKYPPIFQVDAKLKKLENAGFVEFSINREGALIFVDGAIIGLSPYRGKRAVTAGEHEVRVELNGYETETEEIEVDRGETIKVEIELEE